MDSLAKKVNQRVIENTKLAGVMPYLYIFLAVIASVVAYVCFMLFSTSSFLLSLLFAVLQYGLLFVILTFVVGPLIYCVSLQVAEASRYSKKKISLKEGFTLYYRVNRNPYRIMFSFLTGLVIAIVAEAFVTMIVQAIFSSAVPGLAEAMDAATETLMNTNDYNAYYQILEPYLYEINLISNISGLICNYLFVAYFLYALRKNEMTFYMSNVFFTGNRFNVNSSPYVVAFRKGVYPSIKKDYTRLDGTLNLVGYIVFNVVYFSLGIGLLFVRDLSVQVWVPAIAILSTLFVYIPFFLRERIFDNIFCIAYEDQMLNKMNPMIRTLILRQKAVYDQNEDNVTSSSSDFESETNDAEGTDSQSGKKGEYDPHSGVIDFTKDEKNDSNEEDHREGK